ncbi:MAG: hypothetical protein IJC86_05610 [Clostridia bacterium]|nr:hypothetical protein [Clostridia bacterium]
MKKRTVALCLAVVLVFSVFCGCQNAKANKQLSVIVDNINTWLMQVEKGTTIYSYAVTDMDHNGRLEVIASQNYGAAASSTTESVFYEISEDEKSLVKCDYTYEGESQADIMIESADCYEDRETGNFYYIFTDDSGNGFREIYNTKVAVCFADGKVTEQRLATKAAIIEGENEEPTITYTDADGNAITEDEYKYIADEYFKDCKKTTASFGWKGFTYANHSQMTTYGDSKLLEVLKDSYNKFDGKDKD